jgi:hypothetical protein
MLNRPTAETNFRYGEIYEDLLSDDAFVEFPSMVGLVEQMRESFFSTVVDDFLSNHTIELKLTIREADVGV